MTCVTSVSYRYYINGHHTEVLKAMRGLKQGDPITPLIFVLKMEHLHRCLRILNNIPDFKFYTKCERLQVTNVSFTDDLMLFSKCD